MGVEDSSINGIQRQHSTLKILEQECPKPFSQVTSQSLELNEIMAEAAATSDLYLVSKSLGA